MTTIKQMADQAGVSPTTVSNVLHGRRGKISKEKLEKIQEIIQKNNYSPNMGARILAHGQSQIIGVLTFYEHRNEVNVAQDTFHGELISSLETEIAANGYYMLIYTVKDFAECQKVVASWNLDGLIVLGSNPIQTKQVLDNITLPTVFIDTYLYENRSDYYNVGLEDFEGGKLVTEYLIAQDCQKIAFLANEDCLIGVDLERFRGYLEALKNNGLSFKIEQLVPVNYIEEKRHIFLKNWIQSKKIFQFDALFFASDYLAIDCMNMLIELGYHVPEDISIVGFDDSILARMSNPKLTTVHQDVRQKGIESIKLMMKLLGDKKIKERNKRLPVQLISRQTVKVK
ncbi:MAG: LacI family transcriptional regulator [Streptococcaceae bacterium]|jgi:LacI family transcriptional regulator|nr:LacI family transcriptional regulator [Streptococcaceae bacterium]